MTEKELTKLIARGTSRGIWRQKGQEIWAGIGVIVIPIIIIFILGFACDHTNLCPLTKWF